MNGGLFLKGSHIKPKLSLRSFLFSKGLYLFAFFVPIAILFLAYLFFGLYPVGDKSVLVLDLNGQYVYYFENLRDAFWGNGSLVNSWSRNLSGETIGMFAYYLASPFTLVVMLLPRSIMTESLLIMQLLKVGTASVTFCWFLRRSRKSRSFTALMFACMYSLMSYMIVQLMDPMWLDGLIYLPVICRGIEKLCDSRKWLAFIIPLALMFVANFYIGWMIAIFCCVYFLGYYFFISEKTRPFKFTHLLVSGGKFAAGGLIAALCSAWLLIPLYYSLSLGKFTFTDPNYDMKAQFDFIDFFVNLLPNVYDTCRPEGSPVVYCGVLTIILVPLYFFNSKVELRQKIGFGLLAMTIVLSMYMYTVDIVWHGFQVPNWLPYRYSFTFSFLLLIMAAQAFDNIEGVTGKEIGLVFFLIMGYVFWVDKQDYVVTANGKDIEKVRLLATVWFTVGISAVYSLLLYFRKKSHKAKIIPLIISGFIAGELLFTSTFTMYMIDKDVVYSKHSSYNRYITLGRNTVGKIYDMDDGVYRIEKDFHRTVNDAMAFGSYGLSHSSSTLNAAPIQLLRNLGFSYGGHYIKYKGATYVTDAIFGIKYVMEKGTVPQNSAEESIFPEDEPALPEIAESKHYDKLVLANGDSKEIMYVYENPYALPIAFMADSSIADLTFDTWENPFENQNMLLSALISDEEQEFFKRIELDSIVPENAKPSTYGTHSKYVPRVEGENSHIEFLFTAPTDDMIYMFFPSSYERKVNLWLNKDFLDYYYRGGNMNIQALGKFSPGEEISFITTITEEEKEVFFKDNYFYYLDEEKFIRAIEQLKRQPLEIESFREDHIKGTVTAEKDGILFTTIAWEPGWKVYVDGKRTEPVELVKSLVGIPVTEGTHTIELRFFPKGMAGGIALSFLGLLLLVPVWVYERKNRPSASRGRNETVRRISPVPQDPADPLTFE